MTAAPSRTLHKAGATSTGIVLIRVAAWLVLGLLLAPLIVLVGASFSSVDYVSFPPKGFSLQWYEKFFADPAFVNSLILSAKIALASSVLATLLGFPAAYILVRKRFPGRRLAWTLLLSPLLVPQIILGVALLQIFTALGLATSFTGLLLAHTVAVVPYVVRTVGASLVGCRVGGYLSASGGEAGRGSAARPECPRRLVLQVDEGWVALSSILRPRARPRVRQSSGVIRIRYAPVEPCRTSPILAEGSKNRSRRARTRLD